ncbi:uncharacterized protein [Littorina saxatilis]
MGVHVPVPPSIFSHGSICGINLDYLRVVFPRKRVDRLYAVLLECNNDVNAASAKLHEEDNFSGAGGSPNNLLTNNVPQVIKINKATQWTPENLPASISSDSTPPQPQQQQTTPSNNNQQIQGKPPPPPPQPQPQPPQEQHQKEQNDLKAPSRCLFPYCWSQGIPAQYSPPTSISTQSSNLFKALSVPRPQNKVGLFTFESYSASCPPAVNPDAVASMLRLGAGEKSVEGEDDFTVVGKVVHQSAVSQVEVSSAVQQQCPLWSISDVDVSDLEQLGNHGNAGLSYMNLTSKTPLQNVDQVYSSAALSSTTTTTTPWPELPPPPVTSRITLPFTLPPPSMLTIPPGWAPRPLPPLPYIPPPMPNFFHTTACGGVPTPFPDPPANTHNSTTLHPTMEAASSLQQQMEVDSLSSSDVLEDLDVVNVVVEKAGVNIKTEGVGEEGGEAGGHHNEHGVNIVVNNANVLTIYRDSTSQFMNSSQF